MSVRITTYQPAVGVQSEDEEGQRFAVVPENELWDMLFETQPEFAKRVEEYLKRRMPKATKVES